MQLIPGKFAVQSLFGSDWIGKKHDLTTQLELKVAGMIFYRKHGRKFGKLRQGFYEKEMRNNLRRDYCLFW